MGRSACQSNPSPRSTVVLVHPNHTVVGGLRCARRFLRARPTRPKQLTVRHAIPTKSRGSRPGLETDSRANRWRPPISVQRLAPQRLTAKISRALRRPGSKSLARGRAIAIRRPSQGSKAVQICSSSSLSWANRLVGQGGRRLGPVALAEQLIHGADLRFQPTEPAALVRYQNGSDRKSLVPSSAHQDEDAQPSARSAVLARGHSTRHVAGGRRGPSS